MSHGDTVKTPPAGFLVTGSTDTLEVAAMADEARKIYAVQFHPEVHHSVDGDTMLRNFLFKIAKITPDWTMSSFVERVINEVRETVGDGHVVCALSGGVDSTVVAVLLHKAPSARTCTASLWITACSAPAKATRSSPTCASTSI